MTAQQITVIIVYSVFTVPGLIIAVFLLCGKGADLIAGYNTTSPEERAKFDEKKGPVPGRGRLSAADNRLH